MSEKAWSLGTLRHFGVERVGDGLRLPNGEAILDAGKVSAPAGVPRELWPAPESIDATELIVVEGRSDVLSLAEAGFFNVVSVPSARGLRAGEAERIALGRHRTFVIPDCDDTGRKHGREWAEEIAQYGPAFLAELDANGGDGFDAGDVVVDAIADYGEGGPSTARQWLDDVLAKAVHVYAAEPDAERIVAAPAAELELVMGSSVTPINVQWAWKGWVPLGMETVLAGYPDQGKTTLGIALAAAITRGDLDGDLRGFPRAVVIASLEDHIAAVLVPRLMAAKADMSLVAFIRCRAGGIGLDLGRHLGEIEHKCADLDAALLFIDPLTAALPRGINSHSDAQVRDVLAPVGTMAENRNLAALCNMHFNKSATDPLLGVGGSIGFVGQARSELVFGIPSGGDETAPLRVLAHAKCNVGPKQGSQEWKLTPVTFAWGGHTISTSRLLYVGASDVTANDLVGRERERGDDRVDADSFLRGMLHDDDGEPIAVAAGDVFAEAEKARIAERTLRRAKDRLGVNATQRARRWWWHFGPAQAVRWPLAHDGNLKSASGPEPPPRAESSDGHLFSDGHAASPDGHPDSEHLNGHTPAHRPEDFAAVEPYESASEPEPDEARERYP